MKVVILAGGYGTRISEESQLRPKPMVEIGGRPILWHIMKTYSHYGFHEFVICAGYKQEYIKEWFSNYFLHTSDVTFDFTKGGEIVVHRRYSEPWKVTVMDTGLDTMTGGRVKRVGDYVGDEPFMLTYGDAVCDIDIRQLLEYHRQSGGVVTISAYNLEQRFGVLDIDGENRVREFREKAKGDGGMINIGYMVCQPEFLGYIEGDASVLEKKPLETVAREGKLVAYKHEGFWQCMDTLREKQHLESLWASGRAPWKVWED